MTNVDRKIYRLPLFCIVTMLFWFSMYTYVPIFTTYAGHLGASGKLAGIIAGSYGFTQMLLRIPIGIVSDTLRKRRLFINFGLAFAFLSSAGLWLSGDLSMLLIFRSLAGAAAATWVDFTVLFTSYYKDEDATKAIGILNFFNNIAQMSAMLAGSWLAENINWQAPFALGAATGVIGLAASFFIVEKFSQSSQKMTLKGILAVAGDRTLITVSLLAILSQFLTFATTLGFTPEFAADNLGASKLQMGILTVFSTLPTAFASLAGGGYLARRFGAKKVVVSGFVLSGIFTITIPFTNSFWVLLLTQALAGLGRGFSFPLLMGLSIKDMPSDRRATAMGFFQAIYGLGMFIGPVVLGFISDVFGMEQGFLVIGVIGCATALLSWLIIKTKQHPVKA